MRCAFGGCVPRNLSPGSGCGKELRADQRIEARPPGDLGAQRVGLQLEILEKRRAPTWAPRSCAAWMPAASAPPRVASVPATIAPVIALVLLTRNVARDMMRGLVPHHEGQLVGIARIGNQRDREHQHRAAEVIQRLEGIGRRARRSSTAMMKSQGTLRVRSRQMALATGTTRFTTWSKVRAGRLGRAGGRRERRIGQRRDHGLHAAPTGSPPPPVPSATATFCPVPCLPVFAQG